MIAFEVLKMFFTVQTIMALLIGTVGGMVIGALPGLSATMAIALLIPVTFGMEPVAGLVMLSAIYTSAVFGGSISAILLHTPGTPASAATAMDGYALTKEGKGLKALGISTISSMIGGTISALALLFLAPPLALVSLKFNAPEYFLIAIFGLTIIGSLAGESLVKGLASGVLGLMIGLVGMDIMHGYPRYTFGFITLESGIALVPAMIGLFSISQVLIQAEKIKNAKNNEVKESTDINLLQGSLLPSWAEFKTILPTIMRSSVIGVLVGILPGAGGDIGSWVSYNEAKRFSKNPEKFGKGSIEGIAASESANNAVTGGSLIPLLTLGIPGSATAAVLLGGLLIQGLVPGHQLFSAYAGITYAVMFGFLLANILMGVIGLLIAKHIVKVSTVPIGILSAVIVVLSIVGSYAINNNVFDIYVMAAFGLIGYFMRKTGFHPAPVVLAIILGPLAERSFKQSVVMSKGNLLTYFLGRPICIVLMLLIVLALFAPVIMNYAQKKIQKRNESQIQHS